MVPARREETGVLQTTKNLQQVLLPGWGMPFGVLPVVTATEIFMAIERTAESSKYGKKI